MNITINTIVVTIQPLNAISTNDEILITLRYLFLVEIFPNALAILFLTFLSKSPKQYR